MCLQDGNRVVTRCIIINKKADIEPKLRESGLVLQGNGSSTFLASDGGNKERPGMMWPRRPWFGWSCK